MIHIKNKHTYKGAGYFCGRPSVFGNPFQIGVDGSRDEVIEKYRVWLEQALLHDGRVRNEFLALVQAYKDFGELTLVCWCKPLKCHGDVIKEFIEREAE
jgi:hypothetical protein